MLSAITWKLTEIDWNAISAIGTWIFGTIFIASVVILVLQIKQAQESTLSASYHSIHSLMIEIDRHFFENTKMIKYFREGVQLSNATDEEEKNKVMMTAEMLADYFDNVFHQKETLPTKKAYYGFEKYMKEHYATSPSLREYLRQRHEWYSPEFLEMITNTRNQTTRTI